jgi:hypothetical protein
MVLAPQPAQISILCFPMAPRDWRSGMEFRTNFAVVGGTTPRWHMALHQLPYCRYCPELGFC